MFYHVQITIASTLLMQAWAFPTGAHNNGTNPLELITSHCSSGNYRPNHGNILPQASPAPYVITLSGASGNIYSPGQPVTITIEGNSSSPAQTLKGFFLQGDSTEASFNGDITCESQGKKVSFCGKIGVTHVDAQIKDKVTCQWTPPDFQIGRVQFVATIVENFSTFWTGVKSSTTLLADPSTTTYAEKSRQMQQQMMSQFQSRGSGTQLQPQASGFQLQPQATGVQLQAQPSGAQSQPQGTDPGSLAGQFAKLFGGST